MHNSIWCLITLTESLKPNGQINNKLPSLPVSDDRNWQVGVVNKISKSDFPSELKVNMRNIGIESNDGIFEGTIMLFVHDTHHLDKLIKN